MSHQSQPCTAYSTDTQARVEQYFHICGVLDRTGDSDSKLCIVLECARYTYESGQVVNKTLTWHGPFPSTRAAKALIRSRKERRATGAAAPGANQES